jgi:hypothetical protein
MRFLNDRVRRVWQLPVLSSPFSVRRNGGQVVAERNPHWVG